MPIPRLLPLVLAALLAALPASARAQGETSQLPLPTLSATRLTLNLQVAGTSAESGTYVMRGRGGCQNLGDAKTTNWLVGWSSADGSELFTFRHRELPDGKNEEQLTIKPKGKPTFTIVAANAIKSSVRGKAVRFTIDGTDATGRKLKGAITCAGQTT
jgi:hypothetical protein